MSAEPTLSVIIPTRDRCHHITRLLESLFACRVPEGVSVECWVSDNGSKDGTRAAVEALAARAPFPVHYACEPVPGASRARNLGIARSRGGILVFTDDDCVVEPDWLASVAEAFRRNPGLTGLFGRVLPSENTPIDASTLSVKSSTQPKDFRFPCSPFIGHGNNMAFERSAILAADGFDIAFGPGAPLRAGEDLELVYRLLRRGAWVRYEPSVCLRHLPRDTQEGMLHGHRRNAMGLGAFFAKWFFRGDFYALKLSWWWWAASLAGWCKALTGNTRLVRRIKGIYLFWVHYGVLLRIAFNLRALGRAYRDKT